MRLSSHASCDAVSALASLTCALALRPIMSTLPCASASSAFAWSLACCASRRSACTCNAQDQHTADGVDNYEGECACDTCMQHSGVTGEQTSSCAPLLCAARSCSIAPGLPASSAASAALSCDTVTSLACNILSWDATRSASSARQDASSVAARAACCCKAATLLSCAASFLALSWQAPLLQMQRSACFSPLGSQTPSQ